MTENDWYDQTNSPSGLADYQGLSRRQQSLLSRLRADSLKCYLFTEGIRKRIACSGCGGLINPKHIFEECTKTSQQGKKAVKLLNRRVRDEELKILTNFLDKVIEVHDFKAL